VSRAEPRLTIRAIRPLLLALRSIGHDPQPIVAAIGLDEARLSDPDALVPMSVGTRFFSEAVERTGDSNLGLHLAEDVDPRLFDVHFYAMLSSATLGEAYERLCRYQRLIHETSRVELAADGNDTVLRHQLSGGFPATRHTAEFIVAGWVRVGRLITGVDWAPIAVRFAHPAPPGSTEHSRFFKCRVQFGMAENSVVLPAPLLETPCARADTALLAVLDQFAADRLGRGPRTAAFADRVRFAIESELNGGEPTANRIAGRLKMSVRTLNRLLANEGTSYRHVLDAIRHELAAHHLAADVISISEIAFLLGFSELPSFHRAFKRWTGESPSTFRQRHRS
jgi:AraC-like DNA-binding protein